MLTPTFNPDSSEARKAKGAHLYSSKTGTELNITCGLVSADNRICHRSGFRSVSNRHWVWPLFLRTILHCPLPVGMRQEKGETTGLRSGVIFYSLCSPSWGEVIQIVSQILPASLSVLIGEFKL